MYHFLQSAVLHSKLKIFILFLKGLVHEIEFKNFDKNV
jgi:hypothetical protein